MSLLRGPRTKVTVAVLVAVILVVAGIALVRGYSFLGDDPPISTAGGPGPAEGRLVDQGESGLRGDPGSTGWRWLEAKKSGDHVSIVVHHVAAYPLGIYAVYSVKTEALGVRLGSASATKLIKDGTVTAGPAVDYMVGTDGRTSVRIASLGRPVPGVSRYGMNVVVDTDKGRAGLSIDVIEPETPGVVDTSFSLMTNPDPEAAHLLGGRYEAYGPEGMLFGIVPNKVIPTEDTPTYFMISPDDGAIREITLEEAVAFHEERRR